MTQNEVKKLDQRFKDFRAEVGVKLFKDVDFLIEEINKLRDSDPELALRLAQRVKNLEPNNRENKSLLISIRNQLKVTHPEMMTSSSTEHKAKNKRENALIERIRGLRKADKNSKFKVLKRPVVLFVFLPFLIFALYQTLIASPRYESRVQLMVKQPDAMSTLDPSMALLSGFGMASGNTDTEVVKAYIYSNDMLNYLDQKIALLDHYRSDDIDVFSRLEYDASREEQLAYYQARTNVIIDEKSQIISIFAQGFTQDFAQLLADTIVERAEWYINEIGHNLAKAQLAFVQNEHDLVQAKLQEAKRKLLAFQRQYNLLDPETEGMALQQIAYGLESQIAAKESELRALRSSMSEDAPQVMQAKSQLESLRSQLVNERQRLIKSSFGGDSSESGIGEILAKYSDYKIDMEFALQAYTASQISLEKSRIEAYRQLKYLVVVQSPTLPEENAYPRVAYNLSLFLAVALMLFGIGKIVLATVKELG